MRKPSTNPRREALHHRVLVRFDRAHRQAQFVRDLFRTQALRHAIQDVPLLARQARRGRGRGDGAQRERRRDIGAVGQHGGDGTEQFFARAGLEDVAAGAGAHRFGGDFRRIVHREEQERRGVTQPAHFAQGFDAAHPGHADVGDDEVHLAQFHRHHHFLARAHRPHVREGFQQQALHALRHQDMVVGKKQTYGRLQPIHRRNLRSRGWRDGHVKSVVVA